MVFSLEKRKHPRYPMPIRVDMPDLSERPFFADDVSVGGFHLTMGCEPRPEQSYRVSLRLGGVAFAEHEALLAWKRENVTSPASWSAGFLVKMDESERKRLSQLLEAILDAQAGRAVLWTELHR